MHRDDPRSVVGSHRPNPERAAVPQDDRVVVGGIVGHGSTLAALAWPHHVDRLVVLVFRAATRPVHAFWVWVHRFHDATKEFE